MYYAMHLRSSSGREHNTVKLLNRSGDDDYLANGTRRKPTTGTRCPTLFDKWHGIYYCSNITLFQSESGACFFCRFFLAFCEWKLMTTLYVGCIIREKRSGAMSRKVSNWGRDLARSRALSLVSAPSWPNANGSFTS